MFGKKLDIFKMWGTGELTEHAELQIFYRPCIPILKTEFNLNSKCLIDNLEPETLNEFKKRQMEYIDISEI